MEREKISIIIPVYNTNPKLLENCVQSVQEQTYQNLEILLVNDGGTDSGTRNTLEALSQGEHRVRVLHQENQGVSAARKTGVDAASGELLMFVDSDDAIASTACAFLYGLMTAEEADLAEIAGAETKNILEYKRHGTVGETGKMLLEGRENLLDALVQNCEQPLGWAAWGKLYRTEQMKQCYRSHPGIYRGEDVLTVAEYLLNSQKAVVSDRELYYYNKGNPDSATSQKTIKNLSLCRYGYELMRIYQEHGGAESYTHVRAMYCEILFGSLLLCEYNRYPAYKMIQKQIRGELLRYRTDIRTNPFIHGRAKIMLALACPKIFYIQHKLRREDE